MKNLTTLAALVLASSLSFTDSEAHAQNFRRFCDAGNSCFVCQRGQPTCEITYALSRAATPPNATPNMNAILPPSPSPSPGPLYPERAYAPPPTAPRQMTRDEERENVIRQGETFCAKYPDDKVCHPLLPAPPH